MEFKEVCLGDSSLFNIDIGRRITKKELHNKSKGKYPIYSANLLNENFGWTDNLLPMDFSLDYVLWVIDGIWMTRYIPSNTYFFPTDHCGFLTCKNKKINLKYIAIKLYDIGLQQGFSHSYRASKDNIRNLNISIPVDNDGNFDIQKQNEIAMRYNIVDNIKSVLNSYFLVLNNSTIIFNKQDCSYKTIKLDEIIDFSKSKTNNSSFTKKFVFNNSGDIPVYGASQYSDIPSYGYVKDNIEGIKYFENCLTWNIDGSIGCFYRKGRFSLSEKVKPIFLKQEYINRIDLNYLSFKLVEKAVEIGFSRFYKPQISNLKEIEISFPVDNSGEFDKEKQMQIASKYININKKRSFIIDNLTRIIKSHIVIN